MHKIERRIAALDRVPKVGMFRDAERRIRSLSRDEYERLISELPQHLADMAQFSVATALDKPM